MRCWSSCSRLMIAVLVLTVAALQLLSLVPVADSQYVRSLGGGCVMVATEAFLHQSDDASGYYDYPWNGGYAFPNNTAVIVNIKVPPLAYGASIRSISAVIGGIDESPDPDPSRTYPMRFGLYFWTDDGTGLVAQGVTRYNPTDWHYTLLTAPVDKPAAVPYVEEPIAPMPDTQSYFFIVIVSAYTFSLDGDEDGSSGSQQDVYWQYYDDGATFSADKSLPLDLEWYQYQFPLAFSVAFDVCGLQSCNVTALDIETASYASSSSVMVANASYLYVVPVSMPQAAVGGRILSFSAKLTGGGNGDVDEGYLRLGLYYIADDSEYHLVAQSQEALYQAAVTTAHNFTTGVLDEAVIPDATSFVLAVTGDVEFYIYTAADSSFDYKQLQFNSGSMPLRLSSSALSGQIEGKDLALAISVCPPVEPDLVQNAGFETGSLSPWTVSTECGKHVTVVCSTAAYDGSCFASLAARTTGCTLSQSIELQRGARYELIFYLRSVGASPKSRQLTVTTTVGSGSSHTVFDETDIAVHADYSRYNHNVSATDRGSQLLTLSFDAVSTQGSLRLDDVSLTLITE